MNTNELFRLLYRLFLPELLKDVCLIYCVDHSWMFVPIRCKAELVEYFFIVTSLGVEEFDHLRIAGHAYFFQNSL